MDIANMTDEELMNTSAPPTVELPATQEETPASTDSTEQTEVAEIEDEDVSDSDQPDETPPQK